MKQTLVSSTHPPKKPEYPYRSPTFGRTGACNQARLLQLKEQLVARRRILLLVLALLALAGLFVWAMLSLDAQLGRELKNASEWMNQSTTVSSAVSHAAVRVWNILTAPARLAICAINRLADGVVWSFRRYEPSFAMLHLLR